MFLCLNIPFLTSKLDYVQSTDGGEGRDVSGTADEGGERRKETQGQVPHRQGQGQELLRGW